MKLGISVFAGFKVRNLILLQYLPLLITLVVEWILLKRKALNLVKIK